MESKDIMKYLPQIILAIGAIIGIAAFFVDWFSMTTGGITVKLTGKDFLDNAGGNFAAFVPLIILILSIVALIVGGLPHAGVKLDGKIYNIIIGVIGIAALILFIYFALYQPNGGSYKYGDHLAIGAWLGLISALVPIVVGALGFFEVFEKAE